MYFESWLKKSIAQKKNLISPFCQACPSSARGDLLSFYIDARNILKSETKPPSFRCFSYVLVFDTEIQGTLPLFIAGMLIAFYLELVRNF